MMKSAPLTSRDSALPATFRPLFWSYRFEELNLNDDKKNIIIQLINYGTLRHWAWLAQTYSREEIKKVIEDIPATEIKLRTRALVALLFGVTNWKYAQRGAY